MFFILRVCQRCSSKTKENMQIQCKDAEKLAKRMFFLAWKASSVFGMGYLQDNPSATEENIWQSVSGQSNTDYISSSSTTKSPYADYVYGRMMKMAMKVENDTIQCSDGKLRFDYQSWCDTYKTYKSLAKTAAKELDLEINFE